MHDEQRKRINERCQSECESCYFKYGAAALVSILHRYVEEDPKGGDGLLCETKLRRGVETGDLQRQMQAVERMWQHMGRWEATQSGAGSHLSGVSMCVSLHRFLQQFAWPIRTWAAPLQTRHLWMQYLEKDLHAIFCRQYNHIMFNDPLLIREVDLPYPKLTQLARFQLVHRMQAVRAVWLVVVIPMLTAARARFRPRGSTSAACLQSAPCQRFGGHVLCEPRVMLLVRDYAM